MTLTEKQLHQLIYCADEERKARRNGKTPGPQKWNDELVQALCDELAATVARTRQESDTREQDLGYDDDEWLSAKDVAALTGRSLRTVQRHATALGGQKIGGAFVFRISAVAEHIQGAA